MKSTFSNRQVLRLLQRARLTCLTTTMVNNTDNSMKATVFLFNLTLESEDL